MASSNTTPIAWAQRKDSVYITLNLPDVDAASAKIDLQANKLIFSGKSHGKEYSSELEFFAEVDPTHKVCRTNKSRTRGEFAFRGRLLDFRTSSPDLVYVSAIGYLLQVPVHAGGVCVVAVRGSEPFESLGGIPVIVLSPQLCTWLTDAGNTILHNHCRIASLISNQEAFNST
jgi:hypothetical protein